MVTFTEYTGGFFYLKKQGMCSQCFKVYLETYNMG